ncbi:uncharacterized protein LOC142537784 [Primulina tabacum]|uniref:uncharacterized protein LOC142537784 n=1 Tax=Primulina tabacum TaxID=48773 RepID=UPI003F590CFC
MVDSKPVIIQVQELQVILHEIHGEEMTLSESFQVAAIVYKLPPVWKDFKNYLKHKRKEMNVEELIANVVEHGQSSKKINFSSSNKRLNLGPKGGISKKTFSGKCYNFDGIGHKASECKKPKRNREANVKLILWVQTRGSGGSTLVPLANYCSNKEMFATLEESENGEKLFMGNSATFEIKGKGKVFLKMTSGKELTLNNVLYVPDIRKNLVSGSLLNKHGFRIVFESDNVVLLKSGMFVGKGCSEVENQLRKKIKVVRSDHGGEYESPFAEFCAQHGIKHERTAPYFPQQNGIAERKNRTLKEMMNVLLLSCGLPQNMWEEAVLTANYLLNKVPRKKQDKVHTSYGKEKPSSSKRSHETIEKEQELNQDIEPRRSKIARTEKSFGSDFITFMIESEPQSFKESMGSSEGPLWKEAINSEMESILQNHKWKLINLPPGSKPLGCK